jgi:nucleoside-diphosphate-sugar epimerase
MHILVTGAAGHVGSILRPYLEAEHTCRYLDLAPVPGAEERTVLGSVTDPAAVAAAVDGCRAVIHLAIGKHGDHVEVSYDVNVKGTHRVVEAAVNAGIRKVVYASTLSVYAGDGRPRETEDETPNAPHVYGLTKWFGEQVCQAFCRFYPDLSVISFRMVGPATAEQWAARPPETRDGTGTAPGDLARAYLAALAVEHRGFDAVFLCTDRQGRTVKLDKARRLLGWEPEDR